MFTPGNKGLSGLLIPALLACPWLTACQSKVPTPHSNLLRAGVRASSYGPQEPFPKAPYWISTSQAMANLFPPSTPTLIWIVSELQIKGSAGTVNLSFPAPSGQVDNYPDIFFSDEDTNEVYFKQFDQQGVNIWLQVEPGDADVSTLIDLVSNRYASHPCVIGFGLDVEWYKWDENLSKEGMAVSDYIAQAWSEKVRSYNPDYQLFLKHWLIEKMPPKYRTGILFLDDSQEFSNIDEMVNEYQIWGVAFSPSPVGFQIGYEADLSWWSALSNPPMDIGAQILNQVPNTTDLYWVDFTMEQIWPR